MTVGTYKKGRSLVQKVKIYRMADQEASRLSMVKSLPKPIYDWSTSDEQQDSNLGIQGVAFLDNTIFIYSGNPKLDQKK